MSSHAVSSRSSFFPLQSIPLLGLAAVAAFAVGLAWPLTAARAADLYDDGPARSGSAYDDPRYADIYGRTPPRAHVYEYERETTRRADNGCPSKDEISRRLESDGWRGFTNPQVIDRHTASVDAQRPNGRPFRLEVDRCSGEILAARPLEERYGSRDYDRYGSYERYGSYDDRRPLRPYSY